MDQIFLVRSKGTAARRRPKIEFIPDENEPLFPYKTLIYNGIIFSAYHHDNKIFIKPPACSNMIQEYIQDRKIIMTYHYKNRIEETVNKIKQRCLHHKQMICLKIGLSLILANRELIADVCLYIYFLGN